ncbi:MAG TPA: transglycosylase family protein [Candidatus Saccharimonadales bacterium]
MKVLTTFGVVFAGVLAIATSNSFFVANAHNHTTPKHNTVIKVAKTAATPPAPAPQPTLVTVQSGDTLESLAEANGTTYVRLFSVNADITNPDLIYPGQVLRVPTADEQVTPRALPASPVPASAPAPVAAPAAPTTKAVPAVAPAVSSAGDGVWDRIAACESGGNWGIDTGNGFYGGLQFTLSSWQAVGGSGSPNEASREEQISRAQMLQGRQGWGAWPACTAKLGIS